MLHPIPHAPRSTLPQISSLSACRPPASAPARSRRAHAAHGIDRLLISVRTCAAGRMSCPTRSSARSLLSTVRSGVRPRLYRGARLSSTRWQPLITVHATYHIRLRRQCQSRTAPRLSSRAPPVEHRRTRMGALFVRILTPETNGRTHLGVLSAMYNFAGSQNFHFSGVRLHKGRARSENSYVWTLHRHSPRTWCLTVAQPRDWRPRYVTLDQYYR